MIHRRRSSDNDHDFDPKRREDVLEELLQHGSRNFRAYRRKAYAAFTLLTAASVIALIWLSNTSHDGEVAKDALCVLRADLQQRVDASQEFLKTHPQGFSGVPVKTFKDSIRSQERTIDALGILPCP